MPRTICSVHIPHRPPFFLPLRHANHHFGWPLSASFLPFFLTQTSKKYLDSAVMDSFGACSACHHLHKSQARARPSSNFITMRKLKKQTTSPTSIASAADNNNKKTPLLSLSFKYLAILTYTPEWGFEIEKKKTVCRDLTDGITRPSSRPEECQTRGPVSGYPGLSHSSHCCLTWTTVT